MNRQLFSLAMIALPVVGFAGPADQIKPKYLIVDKCIMKKDGPGLSKAFDSFCTKNFIYRSPTQTTTLTQMKAGFMKEFKMMKKVTFCKSDVATPVVKGNEATIKAVHKLSFIGTDGHKYSASISATDTWVKLGRSWKMTSETDSGYAMLKDGKPMGLQMMSKKPTAQ